MKNPQLKCASPVCRVEFEQTGIERMEPRQFCSARCRQDTWHIREVAKLYGLKVHVVDQVLKAVKP